MPVKLSTLVTKIPLVPNEKNAKLLREFHEYMKETRASERHQGNELLVMLHFSEYLDEARTFNQISSSRQRTKFLDSKRKPQNPDPDEKWKTTWNDYLGIVKHFLRWLHNQKGKRNPIHPSEWKMPSFVQIRKVTTKRLSPYSESEIWDLDELLTIVRYEPNPRNKAALTLFWDLDDRNHEGTLMKNKNCRLRDRYGEGEVPFEAKTRSRPIPLTVSFPYVGDWQNEHPARNDL